MATIEVNQITKQFGSLKAVDRVTFEVKSGEIFGLLGPNGAGKTTTIRIILDLFKPDSGNVSILGGPMTEEKKNRIGYLPEERGLYQDITLERCLIYLATLKGLSPDDARDRLDSYLERFTLAESRSKKVKELSKGMQQKAQLIATLIHQPEVLIVDEPFSSLDPVNTQMVKEILLEEREKGRTIMMSTHQMHQVEELCDRIVLINQGHSMLYGSLEEIRRKYARSEVDVRVIGEIPSDFPGVADVRQINGGMRMVLSQGALPQQVLRALVEHDVILEQFEIAMPTLDEIFIQVVSGQGNENG
jgi:ABC-2 type transport system ATP-binding protein